MDKISTLALASIICPLALFAQKDAGKLKEDKAAIKNMCGCMEVTFEYTETFPGDTSYKPKGYHKITDAVEYVTVADEKGDRIILQHLLVAGGEVIKHWTEDWMYQNQQLLAYDKNDRWEKKILPAAAVKGQWTQKVYGVDDEPRYEGTATWIHADDRHYWESTADAPLPRREYTTRSDYNVLQRTNRHEVTSFGSLHLQDNKKIRRENGAEVFIVGEKGVNTYKRIDESKCLQAKEFWEQNKAFWAVVRAQWEKLYAAGNVIELKKKVNDQPFYKVMMDLEAKSRTKELSGAALETAISGVLQQFVPENHQLGKL